MTQLVSSCSHFVVSVAILQKNLAGMGSFLLFFEVYLLSRMLVGLWVERAC